MSARRRSAWANLTAQKGLPNRLATELEYVGNERVAEAERQMAAAAAVAMAGCSAQTQGPNDSEVLDLAEAEYRGFGKDIEEPGIGPASP